MNHGKQLDEDIARIGLFCNYVGSIGNLQNKNDVLRNEFLIQVNKYSGVVNINLYYIRYYVSSKFFLTL